MDHISLAEVTANFAKHAACWLSIAILWYGVWYFMDIFITRGPWRSLTIAGLAFGALAVLGSIHGDFSVLC